MNVLYKADVPDEFCYVQFTSTGYRLFNKKDVGVGDEYYEFFTNVASDIYIHDYVSIDDIDSKTINTEKIYYHTVSSDVSCRADIHDIYSTTFILVLAFLFLVNIITRCIRRGGLFSLWN